MLERIVRFAAVALAAVVVGTMFGIWLEGNPNDLSPTSYVEHQQHAIRALNHIMPVLGALTALLVLVMAAFARNDRRQFALLIAALGCLVIAGLTTRFLNQPINAVVITWSAHSPPTNWAELRDAWWRWHIVRTLAGMVGLFLLIAGVLMPSQSRGITPRISRQSSPASRGTDPSGEFRREGSGDATQ